MDSSSTSNLKQEQAQGIRSLLEGLHEMLQEKTIPELEKLEEKTMEDRYGDPEKQYSKNLPLFKATVAGDWESAKRFLDNHNNAIAAPLDHNSFTALHIAVHAGKSHVHFVEKLVNMMSKEDLTMKNTSGNTALGIAATVGNTAAAKILVRKNPDLLYIRNNLKYLPVHEAAEYTHKDTLIYLRSVTNVDVDPHPYTGEHGFTHLVDVMISEFYDIALDLVKFYPELARMEVNGFDSPLTVMAKKASAFPSGSHFNFWERLIYSGIRVKLENYSCEPSINGDVENPLRNPQALRMTVNRMQSAGINYFKACYRRLCFILGEAIGFLAPAYIKGKKVVHHQALQLVKCLCEAIKSSNDHRTYIRCTLKPIIEAAVIGTPEVIEEIVDILPIALWSSRNDHYIFQLAVINRCEKVFNLIYQMGDHKQYLLTRKDDSGNNILHLAGQLAPPHKLNLVSGAALQMQRELQWYKEVENFIKPADKQRLNAFRKTPAMVFSEEHKQLVIAGEKWMKDTATSCSIATALIVTMVFAAAITVPGGIETSNGLPIFFKETAFKIFFISDAISFFTSTTSLLMFLSILTARYAEQDFLFTLPNRLVIGLVTLFLSTTSMMIAFSATLYLVFGEGKTWRIIPIATLACLPITTFVTLQFPLLVDVIISTYGRGIFAKQSNRPFY